MRQLQLQVEKTWSGRRLSTNDWGRNPRARFGTAVSLILPARAEPDSRFPLAMEPQKSPHPSCQMDWAQPIEQVPKTRLNAAGGGHC